MARVVFFRYLRLYKGLPARFMKVGDAYVNTHAAVFHLQSNASKWIALNDAQAIKENTSIPTPEMAWVGAQMSKLNSA